MRFAGFELSLIMARVIEISDNRKKSTLRNEIRNNRGELAVVTRCKV